MGFSFLQQFENKKRKKSSKDSTSKSEPVEKECFLNDTIGQTDLLIAWNKNTKQKPNTIDRQHTCT